MPAGRPRRLGLGESWVRVTLTLTPKEAEELERLKGDRSWPEFFKLTVQAFKLRRKDYEIRLRRAGND